MIIFFGSIPYLLNLLWFFLRVFFFLFFLYYRSSCKERLRERRWWKKKRSNLMEILLPLVALLGSGSFFFPLFNCFCFVQKIFFFFNLCFFYFWRWTVISTVLFGFQTDVQFAYKYGIWVLHVLSYFFEGFIYEFYGITFLWWEKPFLKPVVF